MKRLAVVALALCAVAAAPALGGEPSGHAAATKRVKVGDDFYRARSLHVRPGTKVTWRWVGRRRHDVYFTSAPHKAKPRYCKPQRKGSCSRRIPKRGTYGFVCTIHGSMTGKIVAR